MRKVHIAIIAVFCLVNTVRGQANGKLIAEMKRLQETYSIGSTLSFDVKYVYATESKPEIYLDSMMGSMEINGNNYRIILNNTETIKNDRYIIHLFKDDKLIYLTKPNSGETGNGPGALIDSVFRNISSLSYTIDSNKIVKRIVLNFPTQSSFKTVVFTINKATGYIIKARYLVKTEQLLETQNREKEAADQYDEYAIVEASYSNYKKDYRSPYSFDEKTVFVKSGNEYVPAEKFKDYSIFLGSPNL
ncbi:MAG: hypothetical protein JWQ40_5080 [Segetibacter sp.]|jgi:hypothetical protein|nr:hypothetical protein [Segetibacter sp.]